MHPNILGRRGSLEKTAQVHNSAWRDAALGLEKEASLTATFGFNALRKLAPKSDLFIGSKTPWLASKFVNRGRQLRKGVKDAGERGLLQGTLEDLGMAPESAHMNHGVALLQDAAARVKIKKNPFMHKPEDIDRLNKNLKGGKTRMLELRDQIKELKRQGKGSTPEYQRLINERKTHAGHFKNSLRELRKEQQVGDLPMNEVMDEFERGAHRLAKEQGMGESELQYAGPMMRGKLNDYLLKAGIDPENTNLRRAQDRMTRWAGEAEQARVADVDAGRSDFGKKVGKWGRTIYDHGMTSQEAGAGLLGRMQLDDVYDPIAKNRVAAEGLYGAATDLLGSTGRAAYAPVEALEKKYGPAAAKKLNELKEDALSWEPMDSATSVGKSMGLIPNDLTLPPAYFPPPSPKKIPKLSKSEKRRIKKLKNKKRRR